MWRTSSRFISLSLVAAAIVVANAVVGYRLLVKKAVPTEPMSASVESASPAALALPDETELIKQAIYERTGLTPEQAEVSLSEQISTHAKGTIKEYDAVGGAYWLAAKTASGWVGVYDGQSQPDCADVDIYAFPADMVSECLNVSGVVVSR